MFCKSLKKVPFNVDGNLLANLNRRCFQTPPHNPFGSLSSLRIGLGGDREAKPITKCSDKWMASQAQAISRGMTAHGRDSQSNWSTLNQSFKIVIQPEQLATGPPQGNVVDTEAAGTALIFNYVMLCYRMLSDFAQDLFAPIQFDGMLSDLNCFGLILFGPM